MVTTATVMTTLPIVTYKHWIETTWSQEVLMCLMCNLFNVGFLLMFKWLWSRAVRLSGFQQQSQWSLQPQWSQHSQLLHKHWIEDDLVTRCSNVMKQVARLSGFQQQSQWSQQPQCSQHSQLLHKHWTEDDLVTRGTNVFVFMLVSY